MKRVLTFLLVIVFGFIIINSILAEDKNFQNSGFAGIIPKLSKTNNDPELINNYVYPSWGPICQRYTYTVTYKDKEGRKPAYMRIIFNGQAIDMEKQNQNDDNYENGVQYVYKFVPNKLGSNFYYFEASNGLGKARAAIIDSPDNGPVLFESAFDKNEIAVIDTKSGQKILDFQTKEEWVGGVALSDNGKYLAAKTSSHIYLFDVDRPKEPKWIYTHDQGGEIGGDVKGGIAISGDGSKIIASIAESTLFFDKSSNKPLWRYNQTGNAYNVAISKDGKYMAAATGGMESNVNSNLLILWNEKSNKPLWQFHSAGNFHDVSLSKNGEYIVGATGCPDRRFYVFSRNSNKPLVKTEMLTRDSPVHRSKISADGTLAAVGSESDAGAVFLFKTNSDKPIWKFPTQNGSSVRALNFTPDGKFIGAATFSGQAYIFDKDKSTPISTWNVNNTALGGIDIADDGSFIVAGGTDKKLHIFEKGKATGTEIPFNEYVEEIDISANGKYVAAGTGGSVYFFESISKDENKISPCATIIEPKSREMMENGLGEKGTSSNQQTGLIQRIIIFFKRLRNRILPQQKQQKSDQKGTCGNDLCEPDLGETKENCLKDCSAGD
ncbi:MAG: WD40 repeat domain-containing protein [bacterium]|nr:WD40 repeat domain-containing protein [bacterium]